MPCNCGKNRPKEQVTAAQVAEMQSQADLARRMDEETAKAAERPKLPPAGGNA